MLKWWYKVTPWNWQPVVISHLSFERKNYDSSATLPPPTPPLSIIALRGSTLKSEQSPFQTRAGSYTLNRKKEMNDSLSPAKPSSPLSIISQEDIALFSLNWSSGDCCSRSTKQLGHTFSDHTLSLLAKASLAKPAPMVEMGKGDNEGDQECTWHSQRVLVEFAINQPPPPPCGWIQRYLLLAKICSTY